MKPAWRTVIVALVLAFMGGLALCIVKGNFADYAALLKSLGWAVAIKSSAEHGAAALQRKALPGVKP